MQKFNKTGIVQRSIVFQYSTREYTNAKNVMENKKKLRKKIENTTLTLNNSVLSQLNGFEKQITIPKPQKPHQRISQPIIPINKIQMNKKQSVTISKSPEKNTKPGSNLNNSLEFKVNNNNNFIDLSKFNSTPTESIAQNKTPKNSIIVPDIAIDNVLSNLKEFEFKESKINSDVTKKSKDNNNIFKSIPDFNTFNFTKIDVSQSTNISNISKPCISSLDDMLTDASLFVPVQTDQNQHNRSNSTYRTAHTDTSINDKRSQSVFISSNNHISNMNASNYNFDNIFKNQIQIEDIFDPINIKKQVRGAIIVKVVLYRKKASWLIIRVIMKT
jgi:hypothetical protein